MILYGNPDDTEIKNLIFEKFKTIFSITYVNKNKIEHVGQGDDLLLLDTDKIISENLKNTIIIFKKDFSPSLCGTFSNNNTAIVSSDEKEQIKLISSMGFSTITCGASQKDTITYSSVNDDYIVASLQREIQSIYGNNVLPFELPIKLLEVSEYSLLAFFALSAKIDLFDRNYL